MTRIPWGEIAMHELNALLNRIVYYNTASKRVTALRGEHATLKSAEHGLIKHTRVIICMFSNVPVFVLVQSS